jgi:hypothetical protein
MAKHSPTILTIKSFLYNREVLGHDGADRRAPGKKEVNNEHISFHILEVNGIPQMVDQSKSSNLMLLTIPVLGIYESRIQVSWLNNR